MKFKKILGLSIFAASAIAIATCVKPSSTSDYLDNDDGDLIYQDYSPNPTANDGYCLLTFDAGEGKYTATGATQAFFQVRKGHNWARIKDKTGIKEDGTDLTPTGENTVFKFYQTKNNKKIFDEYVFNEDNVTLTAKWGQEYKPTAFSTDTWDQVVEAADKGYDELERKYLGDLENNSFIINNLDDPGEVAQKTRYVNIPGLRNPLYGTEGNEDINNEDDWPVHVIGVNHDLIKDSPKSVASLTFEFNYSPIPALGWDYTPTLGHKSWDNSTLKDNLNSYIYLQIEDKLQSGIQTVRKNTDDGSDLGFISTLDEKIFIPSVSEMFDVSMLKRNGVNVDASSLENSCYDYYIYEGRTFEDEPDAFIKKTPFITTVDEDGNVLPTPATAWIRSPSTAPDDNYSYAMTVVNETSEEEDYIPIEPDRVDMPHIVCPCFAIGETQVCAVTSNMEDGLVFEAKDYFAKKGVDYTAQIKTKDPIGGYRVPADLNGKIKVTIDGVEKTLVTPTDYTYNSGDGKLTINADALKDADDNYATLINVKAAPQLNKFQAVSWEELVEQANLGLEALHTEYDVDTFVGLQKYLNIDGINYRTRVIGEAYDTLTDGSGKATLTFEFMDAIGNPASYDSGDGATNTNFPESDLNFRLSSFAQDKMPFNPAEVIKPINTKINASRWNLSYYDTKLFPLSTAEVDHAGHEVDYREYSESGPYAYYRTESKEYYKYLPGTTTTIPTWLRTPNANSEMAPVRPNNCIQIDESGELNYIHLCTDADAYVAPGFCIGHTHEIGKITFSGATDSYLVNEAKPIEIPNVEVGEECIIENVSAVDDIHVIEKENIIITSMGTAINENEWDLIPVADGKFNIKINKVPSSEIDVNICFPDDCFAVSMDLTRCTLGTVYLEKGIYAPDVNLLYSTDGEEFKQYNVGDPITLNSDNPKCYFKANGTNDRFANITNFEGFVEDNVNIFKFNASQSSIHLSGNIMSLLNENKQTTIDHDSALAGIFANSHCIVDASALVFPATGTSNDEATAHGVYAYMFTGDPCISKLPAKITGFNNYEEGNVTNTYRGMFTGTMSSAEEECGMPLCDFSRTCPNMCRDMFKGCFKLNNFANVVGNFNDDYSDGCFRDMFFHAGGIAYISRPVIVPDAIGTADADAAPSCCYRMFGGEGDAMAPWIERAPNMMCNLAVEDSFSECFTCCRYIKSLEITASSIESGSNAFDHFLYSEALNANDLTDIYIYSLILPGDEWPIEEFTDWLTLPETTFEKTYTFYSTQSVINALNKEERGPSTVPQNWNLAVIL